MASIFLSDLHLRDGNSVKTRLVIRFFQEIASQFEQIYILGDLFDVWPGTNAHLLRMFHPVVEALKRLSEDGHAIHYLEGNHDFRLGVHFIQSLGVRVHPEPISEIWGDKKVYLAHGDCINPLDQGTQMLRGFLRHDLLHSAIRILSQEMVYKIGLKTSQLSRSFSRYRPKNEGQIREKYRGLVQNIFRQGYDIVLMGHTHVPDDYRTVVDGRECRYLNTGDWIRNFTYLEYDGKEFYSKIHPVKDL